MALFLLSLMCQRLVHSQVHPEAELVRSEVKEESGFTDRIVDHHSTPLGYSLSTFGWLGLCAHAHRSLNVLYTTAKTRLGGAYLYLNLHRRFLLCLTLYPDVY